MAQPIRIQPDIAFVRELQDAGGESLKKCYQCATCSVACPISPSGNPYPRKEMIWAQWGLKDRLLSDADVWLCYNCGGCSDLCPRGAKPADVMSALRNMAYKKLVTPSCIGTWMSSAKYLPILFAIPAIIFAVVWAIMVSIDFGGYYSAGGIFPAPKPGVGIEFGRVFYGDFTIDPIFILVSVFILVAFYRGIKRIISSIAPPGKVLVLGPQKHWILHLVDVICGEILFHTKFTECGDPTEKKLRKIGHMSLMFGFVALVIVTGVIFVGHWGGRIPGLEWIYIETPLSLTNPIKLLANVGMLLLLAGLTLLTYRRGSLLNPTKYRSSFYDWYLLGVIWAVALTGMFSQALRIANLTEGAFIVYYLHLVFVFMLLAYLPWSKLGHFVYRTAVLTYVRYKGR